MAGRESDKAPEKALEQAPEKIMDGLLRHTLRQDAQPADPCPAPEILAAYFERSLDDRETAEYELHLSRCERCREQYAAMTLASASPKYAESQKPPWAWLWDWRLLAPATAVLVVALVWYARSTEMTAAKHPFVAYQARSEPAVSPVPENAPLAPENKGEPPAQQSLTPAPSPSSPPTSASEKTERQQSVSPQKDLQAPADRKAADEITDNLETDAFKKDSKDLRRDVNVPNAATGASPAAPAPAVPAAPAVSSATGAQSAGAVDAITSAAASNEPPVAAAKTKQAAPLALTNRNANFAAPDVRSIATIVRTPNPQILWRLGAAGLVERSVDGGATWAAQVVGVTAQLTSGSAPTEKICWLAGRGGVILLTTNGADWKSIVAPAKADFSAVVAKNAFEATVTTIDGRKFATTDGGETWDSVP